MKNQELLRLAIIIISAGAFIYLINMYNNPQKNVAEPFFDEGLVTDSPVNKSNSSNVEENTVNNNNNNNNVNASLGDGDENVSFKNLDESPKNIVSNEGVNNNSNGNTRNEQENQEMGRLPSECYPKDTLTPDDLLPQDANSTWAQTVPAGQGSLGDQNFLNAGFHVGINTVGQSLRNANLQLRSEPANPQVKVSPWLQTTIEPDVNRRALEVGA